MKKLVLSLAIIGFIAFGALQVQYIVASTSQVEMVKLDKDPKKEDTKKAVDSKEVKSDTKTTETAKSTCGSSCCDKSTSSGSCCGSEKSGSSSACPDKK
jgi:hypothetical protein